MNSDRLANSGSVRSVIWTTIGYTTMVVVTVVVFMWIRSYGENLIAPTPGTVESFSQVTANKSHALLHVLVALVAVIISGQFLGKLFSYFNQPPVIGEVCAGILLGPSLLGTELSAWILPPSVAPILGVIAQLGAILYMCLVGLELDAKILKNRAHSIVAISHTSILAPFILGATLALTIYTRVSSSDVPFTSFALFLGVAMSITAFPVLARILTDRKMTRTELGGVAMSCAATDDVTAWCLLAFVVGVAKAQVGEGLMIAAGTLTYLAFMFIVARPIIKKIANHWGSETLTRSQVATVFVALLLSSLTTESIGIHAIFGAFLFGAMIPHDSGVAKTLVRQLEHVVTVMLLPAFFAYTGMRTRIDLVSGPEQWLFCGIIILVATIGKFGGTLTAARLTGMNWRDSAILGTLMNTRGLMELIVLNIGLDLRVISPTLFAMMVIMALVTTIATSPVLQWLHPPTDPAI